MDKRSTSRTTSSAQEPTHLDLAEYQAEWARIHENTVRQLEQLKGTHSSLAELWLVLKHSDASQQTDNLERSREQGPKDLPRISLPADDPPRRDSLHENRSYDGILCRLE
ncbi:unnamed protein product [Aspergillus oryzae]|uniref:Unnamed protein product n=2 Tax=Aspergillus oryzae TaxID=5062 RepID=A0AAN4YDY8_ASPOZ|nr:hypothetical protein NYO67_10299 [Aspergillus flavus]GMF77592.1 unnamed protein product [Aspergillus oryzae]GMG53409.1 unnamed protein product [Aspergillus oryzae var. brunneus]GMF95985.1 unnamed protein product [Aspergillus oryzae]GMG13958.1 unnamed protein product [Aspergillus oryzae]